MNRFVGPRDFCKCRLPPRTWRPPYLLCTRGRSIHCRRSMSSGEEAAPEVFCIIRHLLHRRWNYRRPHNQGLNSPQMCHKSLEEEWCHQDRPRYRWDPMVLRFHQRTLPRQMATQHLQDTRPRPSCAWSEQPVPVSKNWAPIPASEGG